MINIAESQIEPSPYRLALLGLVLMLIPTDCQVYCSEGLQAGLLFASPSSRTASLVPEITTHKLYSFKHCLAHYL